MLFKEPDIFHGFTPSCIDPTLPFEITCTSWHMYEITVFLTMVTHNFESVSLIPTKILMTVYQSLSVQEKKADLEAIFSHSNSHVDVLPRLRVFSRLPTELPQFRLSSQDTINHSDGQLTCGTYIKKKKKDVNPVAREKVSWGITCTCTNQCDLDFQLMQNQSSGHRLVRWDPGGGSAFGPRSAAGRGPWLHTGNPLKRWKEHRSNTPNIEY